MLLPFHLHFTIEHCSSKIVSLYAILILALPPFHLDVIAMPVSSLFCLLTLVWTQIIFTSVHILHFFLKSTFSFYIDQLFFHNRFYWG